MDLKILGISSEVFLLIISTIVLIIQLLLSLKIKSKFIKLIPIILFSILAIVFSILTFILDDWDSVGCLLLAVGFLILIFVCGLSWLIWFIFKKNINNEWCDNE